MRRTASLAVVVVVAGLLVGSATDLAVPRAAAQEKKPKDDDKQKEREQAKRTKTLKDIAADFGAKNAFLLLNRVTAGQKVSLSLTTDTAGDYSVEQARGVLDKYFADIQNLSVTTVTKTDSPDAKETATILENVGSFPMKIKRKGNSGTQPAKLIVTLGALRDGVYTLAKLQVDM